MSSLRDYVNVYEFTTTLPGTGEEVKFKPVTTKEIKKLLVYENETDPTIIETIMDELIESSVLTEDFSLSNTYLQDRYFLLLELRKKSKGSKYKTNYVCDNCGSQNLVVIDLDALTIKHRTDDGEVVKISNGLTLHLKNITRGKQKEAYSTVSKGDMTDLQYLSELGVLTFAIGIGKVETPDGIIEDSSLEDRKYLLENIPLEDYEKVREWYNENDFGPKLSKVIKCINCDKEETIDLPIGDFFF